MYSRESSVISPKRKILIHNTHHSFIISCLLLPRTIAALQWERKSQHFASNYTAATALIIFEFVAIWDVRRCEWMDVYCWSQMLQLLNQQRNTTRENKMNKPSLFHNEWNNNKENETNLDNSWTMSSAKCQLNTTMNRIGFISFCNFDITMMECPQKGRGPEWIEMNNAPVTYTIPLWIFIFIVLKIDYYNISFVLGLKTTNNILST